MLVLRSFLPNDWFIGTQNANQTTYTGKGNGAVVSEPVPKRNKIRFVTVRENMKSEKAL